MKSSGTLPAPFTLVLVFLAAGSHAISAEHEGHCQQHESRDSVTVESTAAPPCADGSRQPHVPRGGNQPASNTLRLPETPRMEFATRRWPITSVAFGPNSRYLASANNVGGVHLWDLKLRKEAWHASMPAIGPHEIAGLAFTEDGKNLLFVSDMREPVVLDVSTGKILRTLGDDSFQLFATSVSTCRIGDTKAVVTACGGDLHFWNPSTGLELKTFHAADGKIRSLHVAANGKRIALGLRSGRALVRELPSGHILLDVQQSRIKLHSVALSPLGDLLVATSSEGVVGWQIDRKQQLWSTEEICTSVAISPDGKTLVYDVGEQVILRDVRTGEVVSAISYGSDRYVSDAVAFNADGSAIAKGSIDGRVAVWRLE